MSKQILKACLLTPALLVGYLIISSQAFAEVSASSTLEIEIPTNQPQQFAQVPVNPHSGQIGPQSGSSVVQVSDLNSGENTENSVDGERSRTVNSTTPDQLFDNF